MMYKRLLSFDALKLFAIFLVLWGHCVQHLLSSDYTTEPVYRYIYSVHMPLFMMISGYFAVSSMSLNFKTFITKKSIQLLLPCLIWGIIIAMITNRSMASTFSAGHIFVDFWFLKTCFVCYLMAYVVHRFKKLRLYVLILTLLFSQIAPLVVSLKYMFPCFIIGMMLKSQPRMLQWVTGKSLVFLLLFIAMLFIWDERFWPYANFKAALESRELATLANTFFIWFYRLLIGIVGSLAFIGLFKRIFDGDKARLSPGIKALCSYGQYTLGIYILQSVILETWMKNTINLDTLPPFVFNFIVSPIISIALIYICSLIIKVINKNHYSALLLLGNIPKRPNSSAKV